MNTTKRSTPLFFYGTLRAAEVRKAVLGYDVNNSQLHPASLAGYEVRRVEGASYPMLVRTPTPSIVNGLVMTQIDKAGLDRLDRFEGEDYQRITVDVLCASQQMKAQIYEPASHLKAAELWVFEKWYESDLTTFIQQDFNLDGVRRPDKER